MSCDAVFVLILAHRMDKYYMFLRRYVTASLRMLAREDWNATAIAEYNALISSENGPLW